MLCENREKAVDLLVLPLIVLGLARFTLLNLLPSHQWWIFKLYVACAATSVSLTSSSVAANAAIAFSTRTLFSSIIITCIIIFFHIYMYAQTHVHLSTYYLSLGIVILVVFDSHL